MGDDCNLDTAGESSAPDDVTATPEEDLLPGGTADQDLVLAEVLPADLKALPEVEGGDLNATSDDVALGKLEDLSGEDDRVQGGAGITAEDLEAHDDGEVVSKDAEENTEGALEVGIEEVTPEGIGAPPDVEDGSQELEATASGEQDIDRPGVGEDTGENPEAGIEETAPEGTGIPPDVEDSPCKLPQELMDSPAISEALGFLSEKEIKENTEAYNSLSPEVKVMYDGILSREPSITSEMKKHAEANGGQLAGLENRIKLPVSLAEKITKKSDATGLSESRVLEKIYDGLRYTQVYTPDNLTNGLDSSLQELESKNWRVIAVKNTWNDSHNPYKGINCEIQSPDGVKLEMQFHTPESFELKQGEMHDLYKECGKLNPLSDEAVELENKMFQLSGKLKVPKNVGGIKNR